MQKEYRGATHEAAIVRTALALSMKMSLVYSYANKLYDLFNISGDLSYEILRQDMVENLDFSDTIGSFSLNEKDDFLDFVSEFMLLVKPEQPKLLVHPADFFALRAQRRDFGNGREARRLLQHAIKHQAARLQEANKFTKEDLQQISENDIQLAITEILQASADLEGQPQTKIGFTSNKGSQRGKQSKA